MTEGRARSRTNRKGEWKEKVEGTQNGPENEPSHEIIWRRKLATSYASKQFGITNDTIYWYCKGEEYVFNAEYSLEDDNTQNYLAERFVLYQK